MSNGANYLSFEKLKRTKTILIDSCCCCRGRRNIGRVASPGRLPRSDPVLPDSPGVTERTGAKPGHQRRDHERHVKESGN